MPFQSTHPVWGATSRARSRRWKRHHFNPRTPCGVRPEPTHGRLSPPRIRIHAPRVGCDKTNEASKTPQTQFQSTHPVWGATPGTAEGCGAAAISIHAPRVGCDVRDLNTLRKNFEFQSTHPVWGATGRHLVGQVVNVFQSTHPVWGATPIRTKRSIAALRFQSTHPVWGATPPNTANYNSLLQFQSTHPVWGATVERSPAIRW